MACVDDVASRNPEDRGDLHGKVPMESVDFIVKSELPRDQMGRPDKTQIVEILNIGGIHCPEPEIERTFLRFKKVQECGVFGMPGERVTVVGTPRHREQLTTEELQAWGMEHLAAYKVA